jgi:hypothetical protein
MYILRIILVFLIIFLIVRAFIIAGSSEEPVNKKSGTDKSSGNRRKGVPKSLGEYIDYEEVDKSA